MNLAQKARYARECDRLIREYGAVCGTVVYTERHRARWRARYVIQLLVESDLRARSELQEHTDPRDGGWAWTVEHVGPQENVDGQGWHRGRGRDGQQREGFG